MDFGVLAVDDTLRLCLGNDAFLSQNTSLYTLKTVLPDLYSVVPLAAVSSTHLRLTHLCDGISLLPPPHCTSYLSSPRGFLLKSQLLTLPPTPPNTHAHTPGSVWLCRVWWKWSRTLSCYKIVHPTCSLTYRGKKTVCSVFVLFCICKFVCNSLTVIDSNSDCNCNSGCV